MKTAIVVLAAGAASRMGRPKQLALLGSETLLQRSVRACEESRLDPLIVVLGANAELIQQQSDLSGSVVVFNERWREGMASSVRAGVAKADELGLEAVVVMTCDMPFVNGDHLRALAQLSEEKGTNVASSSEGWRGIPACFRRDSFAAVEMLEGDTGGRVLLVGAPVVELVNGTDVDTEDGLQVLQSVFPTIEG